MDLESPGVTGKARSFRKARAERKLSRSEGSMLEFSSVRDFRGES